MAEGRAERLIEAAIAAFELDLAGLTVFTEAATGPYAFVPVLAARAGARVFALATDSAFGAARQIADDTIGLARRFGVGERVSVVTERLHPALGECDVVTNTGPIRPIDAALIARLRPTAVVPLMWETWEWRPEEVDLAACRARDVLVLGTDESAPAVAFGGYLGALAIERLFAAGLEGYKSRVLLLGAGLARPMAATLRAVGAEVDWFADGEPGAIAYRRLSEVSLGAYDAVLLAEHRDRRCLIGADGRLSWAKVDACPSLKLIHIAGAVDAVGWAARADRVLPAMPRPFGYMSTSPAKLGPRPVLELSAAGLRVGEVAARARRGGASPAEAARRALAEAPAMDFAPPWSWVTEDVRESAHA